MKKRSKNYLDKIIYELFGLIIVDIFAGTFIITFYQMEAYMESTSFFIFVVILNIAGFRDLINRIKRMVRYY